ncbi:replicative DNA helicase [Klebsiella variicola subsp. variicola]|uniref:replicative DNA helicase n=1 Tax=Klebsiella variicola TaxID=244366 RepID=UPI001E32A2B1|nr:replicative DNA helicase [Klebsiella variicola]MCD9775846.1 replicative DNA helicase [Klebsiella variicola subsp. variicola]
MISNTDIEGSVIGGLLLGGLTPNASDVLAWLDENAFSSGFYRMAFRAIKKQALTKHMIDTLLVSEEMGHEHFANLAEAAKNTPSAANLKGYATRLMDYYQLRQFTAVVAEAQQGIQAAGNYQIGLEHMQSAIAAIGKLAQPAQQHKPQHIDDLLTDYMDVLDDRLRNGVQSTTLKTGIEDLDRITGGINPVDLVIVAARPAMGKTEFSLRVAEGVALQDYPGSDKKRGVLIFSMEMSAEQIIERQLAAAANVSVSTIREPANMDDEGWARISNGIGRLTGLDVWIVDASKLTVEQIRAIAERHKQEHPSLSLIMVDYLGLIEKPRAERNDLAIGHISGSLKRMAKDLRTPVISLSQLSRDVEKRPLGQRRPTNADLRDSGSIEQDADSIIMLYREGVYSESSPAAPYAEIIVTKNRFGQTGTVYQEFKHGHFLDTDQIRAKEICARSNMPQQQSGNRRRGADV